MSIKSINTAQILTIADHMDCNDERSLFRGLQVVLDDVGGMMGDYTVRFIQSATEIAEIINLNEAEDGVAQWWNAERVAEIILDGNRWEYDFNQLNA